MTFDSRKKIETKCIQCNKEFLVRKDFLKSKNFLYTCRSCSNKNIVRTFEQRLKASNSKMKSGVDINYFEKINTENKAYWLGFLAGDGSIVDNRVSLIISKKDKNHLLKFVKDIHFDKEIKCVKDNVRVYFRSLKMVSDLEKYYIVPNKTYSIRFPDIEKKFERDYVRGVFDADGCIYKNRNRSSGEFSILGNKEFIIEMQLRFLDLGLSKTSIDYSGKSINRIRYGGINQLHKIYNYLYNDTSIYMDRKKELFEEIIDNHHSQKLKKERHMTQKENERRWIKSICCGY